MTRITRVEVIDENGRSYVNWEEDNDITLSYQDDGRTLKVFVNTMKAKSPAEEAFKRVYGAYPPTTPSVSNFEDTRWSVFQAGYNASQEDYKVEEPEELKTLYQMFDGEQYYHRNKIWHIVKIWMSQYEIDGWEDDWDVGFSDCLDKLNKGLK